MLERHSQVGEHYIMRVPDDAFDAAGKMLPGAADILIYDEERDVHVKITFKAALEATGVVGTAATGFITAVDTVQLAGGVGLKAWYDNAELVAKGTATRAQAKDVAICLARPFIEHTMLSAVLTVSGQDTGATIFGPSDMQASNDHRSREFHQSVVGAYLLTDPRRPLVHRCRPTRRSRSSRVTTLATSSR